VDEAKYEGKTLYRCPHCPFDTFSKKDAQEHEKNPTGPHAERHLRSASRKDKRG
jgi:hypothetical protein